MTFKLGMLVSIFLLGGLAQAQNDQDLERPPARLTIAELDSAQTLETDHQESEVAVPTDSMTLAEYRCEMDAKVRRIEVASDTSASRVPCTVFYYKDTEEPGKVSPLWTANNQEGYCEAQAAAFVERLKSMGWACQ